MLIPAVVRPQYQTVVTPVENSNNVTLDGFCFVSAFATSLLTITGSAVRLTLAPPTTGASLVLASVWIGMANTAPSFDGAQVQVKFGGSNGVTLTAGGGVTVSDPIPFRINTAGTLLAAFGVTSGDGRVNSATGNAAYTEYFKAADAANAGTTAKAGYTTTGSRSDFVTLIEALR